MFWKKRSETDGDGKEHPAGELPGEEAPKGFLGRMASALADRIKKTRDSLVGEVKAALKAAAVVDEAALERVEDALLASDLGPETTERLLEKMREFEARGASSEDLILGFRKDLEQILDQSKLRPVHFTPQGRDSKPRIIAVVGVNGSGKTTTIGKLSKALVESGNKVVLGAGDTFRAAAIDQLKIWAGRTGAQFVGSQQGGDPAAVAHDAVSTGIREQADVILLDTAGRLHTKNNLMEELRKVMRVVDKLAPGAPHETILVLDATTGQNMINQAREFAKCTPLTGIVVTKLDGTAKGGALIGLRATMDIPVVKIGVGEGENDLRDFDASEFVAALFD